MGVAAYRARMDQQSAANAGDAMTQARIAASNAAAQREMQGEQLREGGEQNVANLKTATEEELGNQRVAGTEASGKAAQDVMAQNEAMRLDAANKQAGLKTQAGEYLGNSRINTEGQIADRQLGAEEGNQKTGQGLATAADTTASARAGALAANRQATTADVQNTDYAQKVGSNQATAAGTQTVADKALAGQKENRDYLTGQGTQAQQGAENAQQQQIGAYGTAGQVVNGATSTGVQANGQPGLLQNIAGTAIGALGAIKPKGLAEGGIVTKPEVHDVGERGPEYVVPVARGGGNPYRAGKIVDKPTTMLLGDEGPDQVLPLGPNKGPFGRELNRYGRLPHLPHRGAMGPHVPRLKHLGA
jgi:hypothetical protein